MLTTASDLYNAFLDGIKKSYTGTVVPAVFERIWNQWAQPEWLKDNVSSDEGVEITQKQIDDLAVLVNRIIFVADAVTPNIYLIPDGTSYYPVDDNGTTRNIKVPKYYRSLGVLFSLDYDSTTCQECELTGKSSFLKASYMRSDQRSVNVSSVYRKPKDSLLYWQRTHKNIYIESPIGSGNYIISSSLDSIEMLTDETCGSDSHRMFLEYLTYPNEISLSTPTPSILSEDAKTEIVKMCVEMYLERVRDPRYQSFLMEQKIHNNNKS